MFPQYLEETGLKDLNMFKLGKVRIELQNRSVE